MSTIRRLGLIGDVHAEHRELEVAIETLARVPADRIVCTGDVVDGPGDAERCCELLAGNGVETVRGNHDRWLLQDRVRHVPDAHTIDALDPSAVDYLGELPGTRHFETAGGPALLCHGADTNDLAKVWPGTERAPVERSVDLDRLIDDGQYRYVLNGHMHFRCVVHFDALTLVNAGTLRRRHRPGFSCIDFETGTIQAWEFDDGFGVIPIPEKPLAASPTTRVWSNTREFDGNWQPYTLYGDA